MEPETISKNWQSSKNLMCRKVFNSLKKLILIIVLFYIPFFTYAQSSKEIYRVFDAHSSMVREGNNYVDFYKIYECPGKSTDWLFDKLYAWSTSFNLVISSDRNSDVRRISIVGIITNKKKSFLKASTYANSSLNIEIKEERIRVTSTVLGVYLGSYWYNPAEMYPQKKKVEMTNQTLQEYYYAFNCFMNWLNQVENIITEKVTPTGSNNDW